MTDTTVIPDVEACAPSSTHAIGQEAAATERSSVACERRIGSSPMIFR